MTLKEFTDKYSCIVNNELFDKIFREEHNCYIGEYPDRYGTPYLYSGNTLIRYDGFISEVDDDLSDTFFTEIACVIEKDAADYLRVNSNETVIYYPDIDIYFWVPFVGCDEKELYSNDNLIEEKRPDPYEFYLDDMIRDGEYSIDEYLELLENNYIDYEVKYIGYSTSEPGFEFEKIKTAFIRVWGLADNYMVNFTLDEKDKLVGYTSYISYKSRTKDLTTRIL